MGLSFQSNSRSELVSYVDADWASHSDRKSVSGSVFEVFGNTVGWKTNKQSTVALSSTEAEFNAVTQGLKELCWLHNMLSEIGVNVSEPIMMYEDNQSCIAMVTGEWEQKRLKHMDIRYKFVKHWVENGFVLLKYVNTNYQKADLFTKALPLEKFNKLRDSIGRENV
jgi:ribonuclease HI